jgi:hypothetical protein
MPDTLADAVVWRWLGGGGNRGKDWMKQTGQKEQSVLQHSRWFRESLHGFVPDYLMTPTWCISVRSFRILKRQWFRWQSSAKFRLAAFLPRCQTPIRAFGT